MSLIVKVLLWTVNAQNPIFVDEDLSDKQQPKSSPLVFESVKNNFNFLPLNDSNSFGTVEYDALNIKKVDYPVNHVFRSMSTQ